VTSRRLDVRTHQRTQMLAITDLVQSVVAESGVDEGACRIFVPHTTAAVTINENADPDVPHDVLHTIDHLVPFDNPAWRHGEGNSAAHVKAIFVGSSETVLIEAGRLLLGTWQGLFFCEFDGPRQRQVVVQVSR
jgi:secondary thiamine-phosphate synthase enzyme